jgi:hypothetical protein
VTCTAWNLACHAILLEHGDVHNFHPLMLFEFWERKEVTWC